jgi:hypothetical protein
MIQVYDDLLNQKEKDHIENFLRDPKFPWFLSIGHNHYTTDKKSIDLNSNKDSQECVLLTHVFYLNSIKNSDNYHLSDFVLNRFLNKTDYDFKSLIRSKANLQLVSKSSDALYTTPHVDSLEDHKVLIYYVNDCDGDTFIFQKDTVERISPKKGRFVLFDGSHYHAAGLAKESDFRINLNFNLL